MITQIRAAAAAFPEQALVSLDIKNAFGAVAWDTALERTLASVPALAPALAASWASGSSTIFTEQKDGTWKGFPISGSLVQGNPEGSPVFCLVIATVCREVGKRPARPSQAITPESVGILR